MSTSTTAPPPAVHHYEEDTSRGGQIIGWLKSSTPSTSWSPC